ncbi:MAG: hypothetical protein ACXQTL_05970 [Methanosarcinales archaeon]
MSSLADPTLEAILEELEEAEDSDLEYSGFVIDRLEAKPARYKVVILAPGKWNGKVYLASELKKAASTWTGTKVSIDHGPGFLQQVGLCKKSWWDEKHQAVLGLIEVADEEVQSKIDYFIKQGQTVGISAELERELVEKNGEYYCTNIKGVAVTLTFRPACKQSKVLEKLEKEMKSGGEMNMAEDESAAAEERSEEEKSELEEAETPEEQSVEWAEVVSWVPVDELKKKKYKYPYKYKYPESKSLEERLSEFEKRLKALEEAVEELKKKKYKYPYEEEEEKNESKSEDKEQEQRDQEQEQMEESASSDEKKEEVAEPPKEEQKEQKEEPAKQEPAEQEKPKESEQPEGSEQKSESEKVVEPPKEEESKPDITQILKEVDPVDLIFEEARRREEIPL